MKTTTETETIHRRYSPQSTKRTPKIKPQTWAKELIPDLESKVIGPPDFRTKSYGHPSPGSTTETP
jgi:hypothetical protein